VDWQQAIREERAMLTRIVALLLALADLAELASCRSRVVCRWMLFILQPAETAAWTLAACPPGAWPEPIVPSADVSADMMRLALRFRELALILDGQAELAFSCRAENGNPSDSSPEGAAWILRAAAIEVLDAVRPVHAPDTS
jgi:hypothetical protein